MTVPILRAFRWLGLAWDEGPEVVTILRVLELRGCDGLVIFRDGSKSNLMVVENGSRGIGLGEHSTAMRPRRAEGDR